MEEERERVIQAYRDIKAKQYATANKTNEDWFWLTNKYIFINFFLTNNYHVVSFAQSFKSLNFHCWIFLKDCYTDCYVYHMLDIFLKLI